jgi:hypothetical protein
MAADDLSDYVHRLGLIALVGFSTGLCVTLTFGLNAMALG